ncbi:TPA: hypothetical protein DCW61_03310 [Candidatus Uhrbacteria bacterium]|nr:hypothetical protein [Candidatus Uhrbacteria bacterium]
MPFPKQDIEFHDFGDNWPGYEYVFIPRENLGFVICNGSRPSRCVGVSLDWDIQIDVESGDVIAVPSLLQQPFKGKEIRSEFFNFVPEEFQDPIARDLLMDRMGIIPRKLGSLGLLVWLFPPNLESVRKELGIEIWQVGYSEECREVQRSLFILATAIHV